MYKLEILPEFIQDRQEILEYIYEQTFSEKIVKDFYANIESRVLSLKVFPEMYPEKINWFRMISFKSYLVFYKFENNIVYVHRLFSASIDYNRIIAN